MFSIIQIHFLFYFPSAACNWNFSCRKWIGIYPFSSCMAATLAERVLFSVYFHLRLGGLTVIQPFYEFQKYDGDSTFLFYNYALKHISKHDSIEQVKNSKYAF